MPAADKLRWLKRKGNEWEWVYQYMKKNADIPMGKRIGFILDSQPLSHEAIEDVISHLTRNESGRDFVKRLRNALRQHRYRSSEKSRKICTFAIPLDAKKALTKSAQKLKTSESEIVADALNGAERLIKQHREHDQRAMAAREYELKLAKHKIEVLRTKHHAAMREIQKLAKSLSIWELALQADHPGITVDQSALTDATKQKVKEAKKTIKTASERRDFFPA